MKFSNEVNNKGATVEKQLDLHIVEENVKARFYGTACLQIFRNRS